MNWRIVEYLAQLNSLIEEKSLALEYHQFEIYWDSKRKECFFVLNCRGKRNLFYKQARDYQNAIVKLYKITASTILTPCRDSRFPNSFLFKIDQRTKEGSDLMRRLQLLRDRIPEFFYPHSVQKFILELNKSAQNEKGLLSGEQLRITTSKPQNGRRGAWQICFSDLTTEQGQTITTFLKERGRYQPWMKKLGGRSFEFGGSLTYTILAEENKRSDGSVSQIADQVNDVTFAAHLAHLSRVMEVAPNPYGYNIYGSAFAGFMAMMGGESHPVRRGNRGNLSCYRLGQPEKATGHILQDYQTKRRYEIAEMDEKGKKKQSLYGNKKARYTKALSATMVYPGLNYVPRNFNSGASVVVGYGTNGALPQRIYSQNAVTFNRSPYDGKIEEVQRKLEKDLSSGFLKQSYANLVDDKLQQGDAHKKWNEVMSRFRKHQSQKTGNWIYLYNHTEETRYCGMCLSICFMNAFDTTTPVPILFYDYKSRVITQYHDRDQRRDLEKLKFQNDPKLLPYKTFLKYASLDKEREEWFTGVTVEDWLLMTPVLFNADERTKRLAFPKERELLYKAINDRINLDEIGFEEYARIMGSLPRGSGMLMLDHDPTPEEKERMAVSRCVAIIRREQQYFVGCCDEQGKYLEIAQPVADADFLSLLEETQFKNQLYTGKKWFFVSAQVYRFMVEHKQKPPLINERSAAIKELKRLPLDKGILDSRRSIYLLEMFAHQNQTGEFEDELFFAVVREAMAQAVEWYDEGYRKEASILSDFLVDLIAKFPKLIIALFNKINKKQVETEREAQEMYLIVVPLIVKLLREQDEWVQKLDLKKDGIDRQKLVQQAAVLIPRYYQFRNVKEWHAFIRCYPELFDKKDRSEDTLLIRSSWAGIKSVVEEMVEQGADLFKESQNKNALQWAFERKQWDVFTYLLPRHLPSKQFKQFSDDEKSKFLKKSNFLEFLRNFFSAASDGDEKSMTFILSLTIQLKLDQYFSQEEKEAFVRWVKETIPTLTAVKDWVDLVNKYPELYGSVKLEPEEQQPEKILWGDAMRLLKSVAKEKDLSRLQVCLDIISKSQSMGAVEEGKKDSPSKLSILDFYNIIKTYESSTVRSKIFYSRSTRQRFLEAPLYSSQMKALRKLLITSLEAGRQSLSREEIEEKLKISFSQLDRKLNPKPSFRFFSSSSSKAEEENCRSSTTGTKKVLSRLRDALSDLKENSVRFSHSDDEEGWVLVN